MKRNTSNVSKYAYRLNNVKLIFGEYFVKKPLLTFCIPSYNRTHLLKETVNSILSQKSTIIFQIIILEDFIYENIYNSDLYRYIINLNDKRVILFSNTKNYGLMNNWNRTFKLAQSKYVCTLHDDDMISPGYLDEFQKFLNHHVDFDLLGFKRIDLDQRPLINEDLEKNKEETKKTSFFSRILSKNYLKINNQVILLKKYNLYPHIAFTLSGSILKRKFFDNGIGFDNKFYPSSDYVFLANAVLEGKVYFLNKPLTLYRILANESMKPDTVRKFVVSDYIFHNNYVKNFNVFIRPFMYLTNKVLTFKQIRGLNLYWQTNVNPEFIVNELLVSRFYTLKPIIFISKIFMFFYDYYSTYLMTKNILAIYNE